MNYLGLNLKANLILSIERNYSLNSIKVEMETTTTKTKNKIWTKKTTVQIYRKMKTQKRMVMMKKRAVMMKKAHLKQNKRRL